MGVNSQSACPAVQHWILCCQQVGSVVIELRQRGTMWTSKGQCIRYHGKHGHITCMTAAKKSPPNGMAGSKHLQTNCQDWCHHQEIVASLSHSSPPTRKKLEWFTHPQKRSKTTNQNMFHKKTATPHRCYAFFEFTFLSLGLRWPLRPRTTKRGSAAHGIYTRHMYL